ncbi:cytochrome c oxidase assembly protein [Actinopolymorpha singaporensis]|uniref:Putative membrane protein n=1 Tax=Actinopolymorpha singaporensis TaxID=117157 RepID=A0A1H1S066_9ACTN|nr:cytochrome c oxidase assembly protein [Actinopolymorpha singaporensis]SDS41206.1 putative membrane protein [Actinopolymorpha singaporensis]
MTGPATAAQAMGKHTMGEHTMGEHTMSGTWLALVPVVAGAVAYGRAAGRLRARGVRWPWRRTAAAAAGLAGLLAILTPVLTLTPLMPPGAHFPVHVVRHLVLAMLAPLLLALSAPVTLALRTLGGDARRLLLALLHSRVVRVVTLAPVVLVLEVGGMYAFYLTPLFAAAGREPALGLLVDVHMLLAGCLLTWYVAGRDPMPRRPSTRTAAVVLLLAAGSHDVLAKLMYAETLPRAAGGAEQVRLGAQVMFYGGDAVEVLLATALLTGWYARVGRRLRAERRRAAAQAPAGSVPAGAAPSGSVLDGSALGGSVLDRSVGSAAAVASDLPAPSAGSGRSASSRVG